VLLYILTCSLYCFQIFVTNLENATITRYMVEGGSTSSYVPSTPLSPGRYALRIRAQNGYGLGPETSSAVDFTICKLKCTQGFYVSHTVHHIMCCVCACTFLYVCVWISWCMWVLKYLFTHNIILCIIIYDISIHMEIIIIFIYLSPDKLLLVST